MQSSLSYRPFQLTLLPKSFVLAVPLSNFICRRFNLPFPKQILVFRQYKSIENTVEKGEIETGRTG